MADDKKITKQIPTQRTRAEFRAESFNEADRTVDVVFATETAVRTFDWESYEFVDEVLICTPESGNLVRLNSGAPVLDNHNSYGQTAKVTVGVVENARFENGVGVAKVRFGKSDYDTELMEKVRDKIVTGVSVGYNVSEYQVTRTEGKRALYKATKWEATEISFTPVQADINSRVRSEGVNSVVIEDVTPVEDPEEGNDPEPELENEDDDLENNNNTNNNNMTEEERLAAEAAATRSATEAERTRVLGIQGKVRLLGLTEEFANTLINEGVNVDVASTRALAEWEKGQPLNPLQNANQQTTDKDKIRAAMANALTLRINPESAKVMGEENVRAASEFRGMNFLRFAEESLIQSGHNTRGMSPKQIAQAALGGKVRGMMHTTDFPLLLGDTVHRTLLAQYALQPRTFQTWAKRNTISDFRAITRVRVTEIMGELTLVREGEEYKYDAMGEGGESYKLAKYGKIIAITWEAIVNDDLSAFNSIPQAFSAKAAQKQSDIVYDIIVKNPVMSDGKALFSAEHKNFTGTAGNLTTGGTALSETSLTTALKLFRNQKGPDGSYINVSPKYLIVGPELEFTAGKLTSTNFTPNKQSDVAVPSITGLIPVVDPRIQGYTWFLAAEPTAVDTVEYAFLDGEEELFIEQREGFNIDGVEVKARMVFGAKAIDYRGLYRNNGAAPA